MKKLFGHSKQKNSKSTNQALAQEEALIPTPIHQQHAVYLHQQQQQQQQLQLQQLQQQQQTNQPLPPRSVRRTSSEEERWEVVSGYDDAQQRGQYHAASSPSRNSSFVSLPPGASAPISNSNNPRSPSPFSISTTSSAPTTAKLTYSPPQPQIIPQAAILPRKKPPTSAPVALGILRALDPPRTELVQHSARTMSEERFAGGQHTSHSDLSHRERGDPLEKKEKRGFWNRDKEKDKDKDKDKEKDKDKDRDRERERERERERMQALSRDKDRGREHSRRDESQAELTRMIGYLTATASEDWGLVLEVCERASANEANAKEAVRALRREFKYGEPAAQLSAARLWAIMLRNSSELFISQSTARKFLDTLEDLLNSSKTSPVVRERVLDVIAAAAYASGSKRDTGFRGLWRRVKPVDKPDEGMPFNNDDAMFNPPVSGRLSQYDIPIVSYQEPSPLPPDFVQPTPPNPPRKRKSPTRNRIIPLDEDIRRLFQECKIGQGNASLLSEALVHTKPEDLKKKEVVKEFYVKCRASQELIFAQIPWASAGAEHSRMVKDQERLLDPGDDPAAPVELTTEENLLAALLAANAELIDALQQYDDLERVAMERLAEDISRKETRMDRRQVYQLEHDASLGSHIGGSSSPNGSRSPSPMPPTNHPHLHSHSGGLGLETSSLAPPPPAPHGPRSPGPPHPPRTPSPGTPLEGSGFDFQNGMRLRGVGVGDVVSHSSFYDDESDTRTPVKPSAKALGKRKVVDEDTPEQHFPDDDFYSSDKDVSYSIDERGASSDSDSDLDAWRHLHRPATQFVYDAAAERTQQRLREGEAELMQVNGVVH